MSGSNADKYFFCAADATEAIGIAGRGAGGQLGGDRYVERATDINAAVMEPAITQLDKSGTERK